MGTARPGARWGTGYLGLGGQPKEEAQTRLSRHTRAGEKQAGIEDAGSPHHAFASGDELRFMRWRAPDRGCGEGGMLQ